MRINISFSFVTTRGHYGKNKDSLTFEKFLGPKDYDEHLLIPFEKFLNGCFSMFMNRRKVDKYDLTH